MEQTKKTNEIKNLEGLKRLGLLNKEGLEHLEDVKKREENNQEEKGFDKLNFRMDRLVILDDYEKLQKLKRKIRNDLINEGFDEDDASDYVDLW